MSTVSSTVSSTAANASSTGAQGTNIDVNALRSEIQDLKASDETVLNKLNSILTDSSSSPELRQLALRFFQERQEKESLLSQLIRAMGDTAQRVISNVR